MEILKTRTDTALTMSIRGRIDTTTSAELETAFRSSLDGITKLILDFTEVAYISSAGLRVLLSAQKVMNRQGEMVLCGVCPDIMEVFDITGFSDFLSFV